MSKNSIDKLHDNPQIGDRVVFETEAGLSEILIERIDGDNVHCAANNKNSADEEWTRDIEWALTANDDAEYKDKPKNPTDTVETIAKFRERIIANIGSIRLVILTPRETDGYKIDSAIIDEIFDNPKTGDKIVFTLLQGGSMTYTRTVEKDGDNIGFRENDNVCTITDFRNEIISRLNCIQAINLAPRGNVI